MKIIDVVAAIIYQDGCLLLAQRDESSDLAGFWEFPGGKVEAGESQPQALQRELAEELGIVAQIGAYVDTYQWQQPTRLIRLHGWQVNHFSGTPTLRCHTAFAWVPLAEVSQWQLAPADIPLLSTFLQSK